MEKPQCNSTCTTPRAAAPPKVERKIVEKNRRNHMKTLYSDLISLIPNRTHKEGSTLPDQIDEAVEYIRRLKMNVEQMREHKESLLHRKRNIPNYTPQVEATKKTSPLVEVDEMGHNLNVILVHDLEDYSQFHNIISLLHHQPGVEIANAHFTRHGNSSIQIVQDMATMDSGASNSKKIKELVSGTLTEVMESESSLWDYDIESGDWDIQVPNN